MEKLPLEVLQNVVSNLDKPLSAFATISRSFQAAIEVVTFAHIRISSADTEVAQFESALARGNRPRLVRTLEFRVELPDISHKRFLKFQNGREATENNRVYTAAVQSLFRRLALWNGLRFPSLGLKITSASPKDGTKPILRTNHDVPAWEVRNNYNYIEFDPLQELSPVDFVTSFGVDGRRLNPSTMAILVAALPNLEKLDWWFYTAPRRMHHQWAGIKDSMISLVMEIAILSRLSDVRLYFEDSDPFNQDWQAPSITNPGDDDRLSVALSRLSELPRLRRLEVDGLHTISPAMFNMSGDKPWPALEHLSICISMIAPDGRWYFTGDRTLAFTDDDEQHGYYDEESDSEGNMNSGDSDSSDWVPERAWGELNGVIPFFDFRNHPDTATFDPLITAMIRAVARMPVLREFACDFPSLHVASIQFAALKQTESGAAEGLSRGRWTIYMEMEKVEEEDVNWQPPSEMLQVLEASHHEIVIRRGR